MYQLPIYLILTATYTSFPIDLKMSCDADIESTRSLTSHNSSQNNLTEIPRSRNMQRCLSCLFILSIGILLILVVFLIIITMEEDGSKRQISVNDVTILDDKTVILDSLTAQKGNLYNSRKWFWKNENTTYSKKLLMRRAHHFWCLALSASK